MIVLGYFSHTTEIEAAPAAAATTYLHQHKKHKYTKKINSSGLNKKFYTEKYWFHDLQSIHCTAAAAAAAAAAATIKQ